MKYVIMIHSNPQPWGHPTGQFNETFQALPPEQRAKMDSDFEQLLGELESAGELIMGEALGDPSNSSIYRWSADAVLATDGPYSEVKEHLAGFFMIDVVDRERAEDIARQFASPGDTIELRPAMWPGGPDE